MDDQRPDELTASAAQNPSSSPVTPAPPSPPSPPSPPVGSPLADIPSEEAQRGRGLKIATIIGSSLLLLGGLYVGAQYVLAERVPGGTAVAGIEIGGQSYSDALAELEATIETRLDAPITVNAADSSATVTARQLGYTVDAEQTLNPVQGFTLNPVRLWQHIAGGPDLEPAYADGEVDDLALANLVSRLTTQPVDGTVSFVDGKPFSTDPVDGTTVNVNDLSERLMGKWLTTSEIDIETDTIPTAIGQAEVDRAMSQAETLIAGPIRFTIGDTMAEVPAFEITDRARYIVVNGTLELDIDEEGLTEAITARVPEGALEEPKDARFEFKDGRPQIIDSVDGTTIDPEQLDRAVIDALLSTNRSTPLPVVIEHPEVTTSDLEDLGVKEQISTFSTQLTNDRVRTGNISTGANSVNGTVLRPGETFSLTDTLGPITSENGYGTASVINNGVLQPGMGGGLSQLTTTIYNAAHFAGLEDVEHRPHSMYFSRYPEGREATLSTGSIDLKFKNNTPYGVYIQSWVSGGRIHASIWSTEYWDVTSTTSRRSNVVQPKTVINTGANCIPQSGGQPGFTVTVSRSAKAPDGEEFSESNTWTYRAQNNIVCQASNQDDDDED